ncbi:hypothetical protein CPBF424_33120 [Xanthomonas euroxanthea]|uniref:Uncharacterized protein n=1 Tax=Xanthomonas euroxanthea TaxID=2259622 RepID=A0AA46HBS9_9XANT|nr:hypothetical protein CPBF424_33120 [Xanthomonas euroxanthea]
MLLSVAAVSTQQSLVGRGRDALTTSGTRRESVPGGSVAASMPPRVPEPARTSRLLRWSCTDGSAQATRRPPLLRFSTRTDHLDWSLPAHRRGTLSGMDAAPEPTRTYLRRVPRWWAGKGPATKQQIKRVAFVSSTVPRLSSTRHAPERCRRFNATKPDWSRTWQPNYRSHATSSRHLELPATACREVPDHMLHHRDTAPHSSCNNPTIRRTRATSVRW